MAINENVTNENNEKEGVVVMEKMSKMMVAAEDFNPNDYLRKYEDGTPYLPFKVQLAWFRRDYPNGKTVVYRPVWSEEKEPQTYVATARVYADANDSVDSFLAEASAKRGPGLVVHDTDVEIDPYNAVQVAALSLALKLAGYWVSLTDDDKTPVTEPEKAEAPVAAPEPVSEPVKRRRKKKVEAAAETPEEVKKAEAENQPADEEAPAKEAEVVAPTEEAEAPSDNEPAEETPVETEATAEEEEVPVEEPAPVEEAENGDENAEEVPEAAPVEEKPEETAEPVEEAAPVEENVTAEEEAKAEEETPAQEEADASGEEVPAAVEETPVPAEETPAAEVKEETPAEKPQVTIDEAELAKMRALPFANGYYNGNVGDLEAKRMEGDELCKNLFNWLLHSALAKKRYMPLHVAATKIAEALHPEWLIKEVQ